MLDGKPDGKPGKSAEATFDKAGAVLLGCHLHASMRGHVRVWQADQLIAVPAQQMTLTDAPAKATVQLTVVPRRRRV